VLTLLGAITGMWHHVNCHNSRCWRIGRHKISGTPWCNRHYVTARQLKTDSDRLDRVIELLELLTVDRNDHSP
jgi:hypothetical protein